MIARARVAALHVVLAFANWRGNVRLYRWAYWKLVERSGEARR